MSKTGSAAPLRQDGTKENDLLIMLSRQYMRHNTRAMMMGGNAERDFDKWLRNLKENAQELIGQLQEPGIAERGYTNLFTEQPGLSSDEAESVVWWFLGSLIERHCGALGLDEMAKDLGAYIREELPARERGGQG